jgi:hypothetical protein
MRNTMQLAIDAAIAAKISEIADAIAAGIEIDEAIQRARQSSALGTASWQRVLDAVQKKNETQP